jgi:hypothetical protein
VLITQGIEDSGVNFKNTANTRQHLPKTRHKQDSAAKRFSTASAESAMYNCLSTILACNATFAQMLQTRLFNRCNSRQYQGLRVQVDQACYADCCNRLCRGPQNKTFVPTESCNTILLRFHPRTVCFQTTAAASSRSYHVLTRYHTQMKRSSAVTSFGTTRIRLIRSYVVSHLGKQVFSHHEEAPASTQHLLLTNTPLQHFRSRRNATVISLHSYPCKMISLISWYEHTSSNIRYVVLVILTNQPQHNRNIHNSQHTTLRVITHMRACMQHWGQNHFPPLQPMLALCTRVLGNLATKCQQHSATRTAHHPFISLPNLLGV